MCNAFKVEAMDWLTELNGYRHKLEKSFGNSLMVASHKKHSDMHTIICKLGNIWLRTVINTLFDSNICEYSWSRDSLKWICLIMKLKWI